MALNWKHMKGFWRGDNTSASDMMYTFINFKDATSSGEDLLPDIYINDSNTDASGGTNYGHIITSNYTNTFKVDQQFDTTKGLYWDASSNPAAVIRRDQVYSASSGSLDIFDLKQINLITNSYAQAQRSNNIRISTSDTLTTVRNKLQLQSTSGTDAESANADFCINGFSNFAKAVKMLSTLTVNSWCKAQFFNATSDMRAKEDITPLEFNALNFIKNLNIYSFNYKEGHQPSIGIIAQEVENIDIQGFSLVDNKEASGENNDYMSIKESKLIYILCKAVKELEAEVESLKAQLYGK